jgi:hypothetical protein
MAAAKEMKNKLADVGRHRNQKQQNNSVALSPQANYTD